MLCYVISTKLLINEESGYEKGKDHHFVHLLNKNFFSEQTPCAFQSHQQSHQERTTIRVTSSLPFKRKKLRNKESLIETSF